VKSNIDILFSDEFRRSVEENLDRDPMHIALDRKLPNAAAVASQVKYLRRAEHKLPSYYAARCILPPLAFEQSSSDATAARKNYSGRLAIDLTCGLGVDSFHLAGHFEHVIAIERDPWLAAVARENFRRLGVHNIEVVNASAEQFLTGKDIRADMVYVDPDRRNAAGKKMVRIEDCSPDVITLLPKIRKIAPQLVVKLSPLFDVDEVFSIFGQHACVEVVSLDDECKEIVAEILTHPEITGNSHFSAVRAVAIGIGEFEHLLPLSAFRRRLMTDMPTSVDELASYGARLEPEKYRYLIIPDVALQKARLAQRYFSELGGGDIYIDSDNGYAFSAEKPENIMGRSFEIARIEPFDPKALKRCLKNDNIKNIDILRRNFPLSTAEIARHLCVREGGSTRIAFTKTADSRLWQIHLVNR
jgi:hypothetical protein